MWNEKAGSSVVTEEHTLIACPKPYMGVNGWAFRDVLEEFEANCDDVEFLEHGIVVPEGCPFTKIKGVKKHPWIFVNCDVFLKFYEKREEDHT